LPTNGRLAFLRRGRLTAAGRIALFTVAAGTGRASPGRLATPGSVTVEG